MDEKFMRLALNEARKALAAEEVPISPMIPPGRLARGGRGAGAQPRRDAFGPHGARRNAGPDGRCGDRRGQVPARVHALRDGRAVRHVRRGDRVGADGARGVGRRRSEEGLPPLFGIGPPSQDLRDAGDSRRGVRRADDFVFRPFARVVFEEKEKFYTFANDASDQAGRVEREKN